jgi:hypothetical protein
MGQEELTFHKRFLMFKFYSDKMTETSSHITVLRIQTFWMKMVLCSMMYVCSLGYLTVACQLHRFTDYTASDDNMIMNNELGWM